MKASLLAKIAGWAIFGVTAAGQLLANGTPHGAFGWIQLAGSLLSAVGLHAASNTDGTK